MFECLGIDEVSKVVDRRMSLTANTESAKLKIVTLCTGNVARSVMLSYMLTTISDERGRHWEIRSAGTHVVEGSAMSGRTRDALLSIEVLGEHRYGAHRSHQLTGSDVEWADVILAAEVINVKFVRAHFAAKANTDKAVLLAQFVRAAPEEGGFHAKLRAAASLAPSTEFDVVDPAGGDQATYDHCAQELWSLAKAFAILADDRVN